MKITSLRDNKRSINIYELLCAKLCSKSFMCMNSFNPHHKCTRGAQFSSHFTDEDAETQRGQVPWPRSHSQDMVKRTFPSLFLVLIDLGTQPTPTPPWRVLADPCWPSASHRVLCLHARLSASCLELLRRQFPWQPQDGSSQAAWEGDAAPTLAFVPTGSGWRGWTGGASLRVWSRGLNIGGGAWQDGEQGRGSRRARGWEVGPAWVVYSYGSGFGVAGGG